MSVGGMEDQNTMRFTENMEYQSSSLCDGKLSVCESIAKGRDNLEVRGTKSDDDFDQDYNENDDDDGDDDDEEENGYLESDSE